MNADQKRLPKLPELPKSPKLKTLSTSDLARAVFLRAARMMAEFFTSSIASVPPRFKGFGFS
jgi:hypothetical protein